MTPLTIALLTLGGAGVAYTLARKPTDGWKLRSGETWRIKLGIQPELGSAKTTALITRLLSQSPGAKIDAIPARGMTVLVITKRVHSNQTLPSAPWSLSLGTVKVGVVVLEAVRIS